MKRVLHLAPRARVVVVTVAVSAVTFALLALWFVQGAARSYSRAVASNAHAFTAQVAPLAGSEQLRDGYGLTSSADWLVGVAVFGPDGTLLATEGHAAAAVRSLVAESGDPSVATTADQFLLAPDGTRTDTLSVRSDPGTLQITVVPIEGGGSVASAVAAKWAVAELRTVARTTIGAAAAGILIISLALALAITRLVTRPVEEQAADAERSARTDGLTGIANRRAFTEALDAAVASSRSSGAPLSLLSIDVDGLKALNDAHGHQAGDRMLQSVASTLQGATRGGDFVARVGGDEFAVLCPGMDRLAAREVVDRIQRALDAAGHRASVGIGELLPDGTAQELVSRADTAMYAVKARRKAAAARPA